jgi:hypothetical protein
VCDSTSLAACALTGGCAILLAVVEADKGSDFWRSICHKMMPRVPAPSKSEIERFFPGDDENQKE